MLVSFRCFRWHRVSKWLKQMPDEEAFCLLVRLMHSYGLRGHFLPEMPGLQLRMYQVSLALSGQRLSLAKSFS